MWSLIFSGAVLTLLSAIIGFGTRVFLSHTFSESSLLAYYLMIDSLFYFVIFLSAYKDPFVSLYTHEKRPGAAWFLYTRSYLKSVLFCLLIGLPILFFSYLAVQLNFNVQDFLVYEGVFILIALVMLPLPLFLIKKVYRVTLLKDFLKAALFLLAMFGISLMIWAFESETQALLIGFAISEVLVLLWMSRYRGEVSAENESGISYSITTIKKGSSESEFRKNYWITLITYGASHFSFLGFPLVMLAVYGTGPMAGYMVVARPIYMTLMTVFSFSMFKFLFPHMSKEIARGNYAEIISLRRQFIYGLLILTVLLMTGTWLLSEWLVEWLFPENYKGAYALINILILAIPFVLATTFSTTIVKGGGDYWGVFKIRLLGILVLLTTFAGVILSELPFKYVCYSIVLESIAMAMFSNHLQAKLLNNMPKSQDLKA